MRYVALCTLLVTMIAGCSSEEPVEDATGRTAQPTTAPPQFIIDVRSAAEFDTGHIEGAVNIPHGEIGTRISEVTEDKDQPIVLYCRSGGRSGMALATLEELGYTQVENAGGYQALKEKLGQ